MPAPYVFIDYSKSLFDEKCTKYAKNILSHSLGENYKSIYKVAAQCEFLNCSMDFFT